MNVALKGFLHLLLLSGIQSSHWIRVACLSVAWAAAVWYPHGLISVLCCD